MAGKPGMRKKLLSSPQIVEKFRNSIRVALIRNRLMKHIVGELELSNSQINAAKALLDKCIPNVSSVELTGANGGPIQHEDVSNLELARLVAFTMAEGAREVERIQQESKEPAL